METELTVGYDPGTNFPYPVRSLFPQDSLEAAVMKMKKTLIVTLALMLGFSTVAWGGEIADTDQTPFTTGAEFANRPWNAANIDALRALDKAVISKFYDTVLESPAGEGVEMGGLAWVDLAGDGKYEMLITWVSRHWAHLDIFWQDAPGKLRTQSFDGASPDPNQTIEDLNGDGKKELILGSKLDSDFRTPLLPRPVASWPQVYRLRNGRYVEASRDFPRFYDTEVLPELEKGISGGRRDVAEQQGKPKPTPGPNAAPTTGGR